MQGVRSHFDHEGRERPLSGQRAAERVLAAGHQHGLPRDLGAERGRQGRGRVQALRGMSCGRLLYGVQRFSVTS
jgi:hypothetical protein